MANYSTDYRRSFALSLSLISILCLAINSSSAQDQHEQNELMIENHAPVENKNRLAWTLGLTGATYFGSSVVLYNSWYKDYPQGTFHFHNDWGEWRNVDKAGHVFSGYFQSNWAYKGWRWAGLEDQQAIWAGAGTSFLAQTTIEVMDGFSSGWGFSIPDFASNLVGIGSFAIQQSQWGEQKILFKTSSTPIDYQKRYGSEIFQDRANELYGKSVFTRLLKDYNAQTTWISVNVKSFLPKSPFPDWLNIAVGYGAENMFGGYENSGIPFEATMDTRRYSQYYLSLDVDFSRIKTDSPFLRTLLDVLNIFKVPFSALELTSLGDVKMHAIRF